VAFVAAVPLFSPSWVGDPLSCCRDRSSAWGKSCSSSRVKREGKATSRPKGTKRLGNQHGMRITLGQDLYEKLVVDQSSLAIFRPMIIGNLWFGKKTICRLCVVVFSGPPISFAANIVC